MNYEKTESIEKRGTKMKKKIIGTFLIMFFVFSAIIGTGMYMQYKPDVEKIIQEEKKQNAFESLDISNYKERINVLLLGVDTLENKNSQSGQTGTRSDTIIILSVDPVTKTGFILSVPRDSYVRLPDGTQTKINHAHSYGGTELALQTIKEFVKIPIHHYVKVDYRALFKTVDDLGGIEFDVPIDMKYRDSQSVPPLNIDLKAGVQVLNGEQAMGLLRFRKAKGYDDFGRMETQQKFIESVFKKVVSPSSIPRIPDYVDTIYKYVETDMSTTDILSLLKIGLSIDFTTLQKATLPATPIMIGGISYMDIDKVQMQEQIDFLLAGVYEKPEVPEENAENTDSTDVNNGEKSIEEKSSADKKSEEKTKNINSIGNQKTEKEEKRKDSANMDKKPVPKKISVLNGSGVSGVARRVSDLLKIRDITVTSTGNASSFDNENTIIYYKNDSELAQRIKEILKVGSIKKGTKTIVDTEPDIVILIGKDFN